MQIYGIIMNKTYNYANMQEKMNDIYKSHIRYAAKRIPICMFYQLKLNNIRAIIQPSINPRRKGVNENEKDR